MNTERIVVGAHGFIFPAGTDFTIPAAGTAARTAKPGPTDEGWIDVGVSDWGFSPQHKSSDFMAPSPGMRQLYDKITTQVGMKLKGKLMETSNLVYQMLLATAALPVSPEAGGQYNPLGGDPVVRAWLKLQQYNQRNVLINTMDVFVALTIPGDIAFDDKEVDVQTEADVLYSTLNTGTLT